MFGEDHILGQSSVKISEKGRIVLPTFTHAEANDEVLIYLSDDRMNFRIFSKNKIDKVVHIAARAGVRPSLEDPLEYIRSNIDGTINILENMRKVGVKKIVFASSSSVYGNCREILRFFLCKRSKG